MKLIGNLKKTVDEIDTMEGKKEAIRKAGMALTDDELEQISGGQRRIIVYPIRGNNHIIVPDPDKYCSCDNSYVGYTHQSNNVRYEVCGNCGKYISWDTY